MPAEIEPLDTELLRKRAVQLRAFIDQDPDDTDEDGDPAIIHRVYTHDELEAIAVHHEKIGVALDRIEADYSKLCQLSTALEASQDALDALVIVEALGARVDDEEPDDDDPYDGDGDDHTSQGDDDEEHDPDADLADESDEE